MFYWSLSRIFKLIGLMNITQYQNLVFSTNSLLMKVYELFVILQCSNLMLVESIPKEPLNFQIIPFDNPRGQHMLQVRFLHLNLLSEIFFSSMLFVIIY